MIVGTHGRLKTWMSKRTLALDNIKILVLDEADEMLKVMPNPLSCYGPPRPSVTPSRFNLLLLLPRRMMTFEIVWGVRRSKMKNAQRASFRAALRP